MSSLPEVIRNVMNSSTSSYLEKGYSLACSGYGSGLESLIAASSGTRRLCLAIARHTFQSQRVTSHQGLRLGKLHRRQGRVHGRLGRVVPMVRLGVLHGLEAVRPHVGSPPMDGQHPHSLTGHAYPSLSLQAAHVGEGLLCLLAQLVGPTLIVDAPQQAAASLSHQRVHLRSPPTPVLV